MKQFITLLVFCTAALLAQAQDSAAAKTFDGQLSMLEREFVPLVEAMPADKFSFAPTQGEFKGARTFAQQATHSAAVLYAVCAAVLGEKNPTDMGQNENGPASLKSKDDVVKYVKEAFAYGHKAMRSLTNENLTGMVASPFGSGSMVRLGAANIALWHSFDHYGQMAVYLRMNGIIPPASRPR